MITVRPATQDDAERLLAWANDPVTRAAGYHPAPIHQATHARWLAERLASPSNRMFIGMDGDRPVGQVRLDAEADGRLEVGISVASEARGQGVGHAMLEAALAAARADPDLPGTGFVARIRPDNAPSLALFAGAGFRPAGVDEVAGVPCLVYERPAG